MMAKLPTRIPSEQIKTIGGWQLQELSEQTGSKVFRTSKPSGDQRQRAIAVQKKNQAAKPAEPKREKPAAKQEIAEQEAPPTPSPAPTPEPDPIVEAAPEPEISVAQIDPEDAGYQAGYQKGETEGFVKGEQTGYSAGLEAGTAEGRQSAENTFNQEVSSQRELLTNLVRALSEPPKYEAGLEQALVNLVSEIAQVVLVNELKTESQHITELVYRALEALPHHAKSPRVFLNPSDIPFVESNLSADMQLIADAGLARGGCRVETEESQIDGTLANRIRGALLAACGEDPAIQASEADLQNIDSALDP